MLGECIEIFFYLLVWTAVWVLKYANFAFSLQMGSWNVNELMMG